MLFDVEASLISKKPVGFSDQAAALREFTAPRSTKTADFWLSIEESLNGRLVTTVMSTRRKGSLGSESIDQVPSLKDRENMLFLVRGHGLDGAYEIGPYESRRRGGLNEQGLPWAEDELVFVLRKIAL